MTTSLAVARPVSLPATRIGATAGAVGPVLFTVTFVLQNVLRDDDDVVAEPVSALAAGDHGWVQSVNFVVFGVLMAGLAVGLFRVLPRTVPGRLGAVLLGVSAFGLLAAAAFPLRENAAGEIYDPGLHSVAGVTFFSSSALALLALSRPLAADHRWRPLGTWCAVAGTLGLVGFVVLGTLAIPDSGPLHPWAGLAQRIVLLLVTFPCLVAVATRLRRIGASPGDRA